MLGHWPAIPHSQSIYRYPTKSMISPTVLSPPHLDNINVNMNYFMLLSWFIRSKFVVWAQMHLRLPFSDKLGLNCFYIVYCFAKSSKNCLNKVFWLRSLHFNMSHYWSEMVWGCFSSTGILGCGKRMETRTALSSGQRYQNKKISEDGKRDFVFESRYTLWKKVPIIKAFGGVTIVEGDILANNSGKNKRFVER